MIDSARASRIDHTSLTCEAERIWERARRMTASERSELYVKFARRRRVERNRRSGEVTIADAIETGSAFRWQARDDDRSHHVAMGGLDAAAIERAVTSAGEVTASSIPFAGIDASVPKGRLDLDPEADLPEHRLREAVRSRSEVRWVEAGTTIEVLVGAGGWSASRLRHRAWAQIGESSPRFVSRRGFELDAMLELEEVPAADSTSGVGKFGPEASSALVVALATLFHLREAVPGGPVGPGWVVADDPGFKDGIAGGAFDDAGFPTRRMDLADGRRATSIIAGSGTYWRRSFRDPPRSIPSTLVVAPPLRSDGEGAGAAERCRVIPIGSREWVLETDLGAMRVHPESLLSGCLWGFGPSRISPEGVVTPGLAFAAEAFRQA